MVRKDLTSARILAVDDQQMELDLLATILRKAGYANFVATLEPAAAIDLFRARSPDLVLLDLHMPGVSGFELLGRLANEIEPNEYLPILVLTGDISEESKSRALSIGAKDFVTKPFSASEVVLRIANLLETRASYQESTVLLQETLTGVVAVLTQVLTAVHPQVVDRVRRVRTLVHGLSQELGASAWEVELAAMMSHVGCLSLPPGILQHVLDGESLPPEQAEAFREHPVRGAALLERIPRLETIAGIVRHQQTRWSSQSGEEKSGIPPGAWILKAALDFDALRATGLSAESTVLRMESRVGWYAPNVLNALGRIGKTAA